MSASNTVGNIVHRVAPQGGLLRTGNPGNRGGGRHPDRIKRIAQQELRKRIRLLGHLADGVSVAKIDDANQWQEVSPGEKIRALEALHKIGMGETVAVSDVRQRLKDQLAVMRTKDQWDTAELVALIGEVWR